MNQQFLEDMQDLHWKMEIYIEDVSEHNGTFINGSKLPPLGRSKINAGDKVNLGRAEIIIDKILY